MREEGEPTDSHIAIGPGVDDLGEDAEDDVVVIRHDGVRGDLDGEDGGEEPQPIQDPSFTVREVAVRDGVESGEESSADTPVEAMINAFMTFANVFAAGQCHSSPHFT